MENVRDGWMEAPEGFLNADYLQESDPLSEFEYAGEWLTTAYTHTGQACANGEYPENHFTIAANSLPIGTEVYIRGVGFRTVEDRGPAAMPASWLDIFMDSESDCVLYGMQYHDVWIIR